MAGVDVPAAALTTAAAISTMVLPPLLFTHRLPLASKAIPSGPLKTPGPTAGLVNTAAGVPENPAPVPNCAVLNLKIAPTSPAAIGLVAESLTHRFPAASKAANCGKANVGAPVIALITKFGAGFGVVLRLATWLNRNLNTAEPTPAPLPPSTTHRLLLRVEQRILRKYERGGKPRNRRIRKSAA